MYIAILVIVLMCVLWVHSIWDPAWENYAYVHKIHLFTLLQLSHFLCKLYKFCSSYWILVLDDHITKPYSERYWPHLLLLLLSVHVFSWHHTYDVMVHNNVQWGALGSTLKLSANYTYVFIVSSYYLTTVSNIQCTECSVLMTLWTPSLRQLLATYYIQ